LRKIGSARLFLGLHAYQNTMGHEYVRISERACFGINFCSACSSSAVRGLSNGVGRSGYVGFGSIADVTTVDRDVSFVPGADINHHLFSAVVIALIRLVQFGGPVEIRPSTPTA